MALIVSRQQLHAQIDALPENAEIILMSAVQTELEGKPFVAQAMNVVGIAPQRINERVVYLLYATLQFFFLGVVGGPR